MNGEKRTVGLVSERLQQAQNARHLDAFVDCFAENYSSEQPVHPNRSFQGREQVKKNWASIFNEIPDFSAQLIRHTINNGCIWSEWEWQGTRMDNSKLFIRGVMIMGVQEGKIIWGRLYVEPVEVSGKGIEGAVQEVMHGKTVD